MIAKTRKGKFIGGPYDGISQDMFVWDMSDFPKILQMTKHPNMKPTLGSIRKACNGESFDSFIEYKFLQIDSAGDVLYQLVEDEVQ